VDDVLCYSVADACSKLGGISRSSLYRLLRAGELVSGEVCGRRMIETESLVRYADRVLTGSKGGDVNGE